MYRAILKARPVTYSEKIEKQAQKQSELNIRPNEFSQVLYKNQPFKELSGINCPPLGSTQMNRWYNDYVKSNMNRRLRKPITKFEEALFSPSTKEVGFGVTKKGNKLIIVCRFR